VFVKRANVVATEDARFQDLGNRFASFETTSLVLSVPDCSRIETERTRRRWLMPMIPSALSPPKFPKLAVYHFPDVYRAAVVMCTDNNTCEVSGSICCIIPTFGPAFREGALPSNPAMQVRIDKRCVLTGTLGKLVNTRTTVSHVYRGKWVVALCSVCHCWPLGYSQHCPDVEIRAKNLVSISKVIGRPMSSA